MPGENIMKLGEQWEIEMPGFGKMTVRNINKNKVTNTNTTTRKQNKKQTNETVGDWDAWVRKDDCEHQILTFCPISRKSNICHAGSVFGARWLFLVLHENWGEDDQREGKGDKLVRENKTRVRTLHTTFVLWPPTQLLYIMNVCHYRPSIIIIYHQVTGDFIVEECEVDGSIASQMKQILVRQ